MAIGCRLFQTYLFQLVHERSGVHETLLVGIVQAFGQDLVDDPVIA